MKTVVVLSPPRSGSSLLAGILHRLGISMGPKEDLIQRKFLNRFGCYEDLDFVTLNLRVLARTGGLFHISIPNDKRIADIIKSWDKYVKLLIKSKEKTLWGWKDPSTVYTIPFIHKDLTNPHYICLRRDINSIVDSQFKVAHNSTNVILIMFRYYYRFFSLTTIVRIFFSFFYELFKHRIFMKDRNKIKRKVIDAYKRINSFAKDKKHIYISLDDLIDKPIKSIQKLINFLGITPSDKQISKALSFIHPGLIDC